MHKIDPNVCVKCGACAGECPVQAIKEAEASYEVGEDCVDCGACESACPTGAISA
ncbi:4Fe-4S binding protein [bacterium]|nr:4Fe-4S binding protein [bacterium]MBP5435708.1 4Fe-4S binding protein [bacterium]MBR6244135.1 4Fe-4S binding protein [bacterium]